MKAEEIYDILGERYEKWEEIPVSTLKFSNTTEQICYVKLTKNEAVRAINDQALPLPITAYEYKENIHCNEDEVILAVKLNTKNMLDLTNEKDYIAYMDAKINNKSIEDSYNVIRKIELKNNMNILKIVYGIRNNAPIFGIERIK